MTTRAREVEALLRDASHVTIEDGIPVERCALSRALVIEAASALSALIAECEWRDIASAPKDGTKVDLWVVHHELPKPDTGYRETDARWTAEGWVRTIEDGDYSGEDREIEWSAAKDVAPTHRHLWTNEQSDTATHWRPLPPPPTPELITGEVGREFPGEEKGETK